MSGWIKLHRSILDWEWYSDVNTSRLFTHLLLKANYKPKNWKGIPVAIGQTITSRETLSRETGLSIQQIRTSLNKLKSTSDITIKSTSTYTVVTLAAYSLYQSMDELPTIKITSDSTNEQQTDNKPITTTKEVKNIRMKEIDNKYLEIARQLSIVALRRIPSLDYKESKWGDDVRKLIEIDGKTPQELFAVWSYIDQHENNGFSWGDNIRTPAKLRTKKDGLSYYDKIIIEMKRGSPNGQNRPKQHIKETPLERMARKQKSMDMRSATPEYYGQIVGENDTVVSTQVGINGRGSFE
jgi:hypothetical protein